MIQHEEESHKGRKLLSAGISLGVHALLLLLLSFLTLKAVSPTLRDDGIPVILDTQLEEEDELEEEKEEENERIDELTDKAKRRQSDIRDLNEDISDAQRASLCLPQEGMDPETYKKYLGYQNDLETVTRQMIFFVA